MMNGHPIKATKTVTLTCLSFRFAMTDNTSLVETGGFRSNLPNCE